jgi:hypothetical protein
VIEKNIDDVIRPTIGHDVKVATGAVGVSADERARSARNAMDGSDEGAVSNAGGAVSVPTDGAGHGKVPSFSDGVLQKRDHIDATIVEGAAASVIMAGGTAVIAVAAVAAVAALAVTATVLVDSSEQIIMVVLIDAAVSAVATSLTGAGVDAAAGVLVRTEMSSGGAVSFTEGASFATPSISLVFGMADGAVLDTGGVIDACFTLLSVLFSASGLMVATAAGAAADAAAGELVGTEMFSDGADLGTGGVGGAGSFALLVSFVPSDMTVAAATGAAADSATGALVGFEKSDGAIPYTGGIVGAGFTSSFTVDFVCIFRYDRCIGGGWNVLRWRLLIRSVKINVFR